MLGSSRKRWRLLVKMRSSSVLRYVRSIGELMSPNAPNYSLWPLIAFGVREYFSISKLSPVSELCRSKHILLSDADACAGSMLFSVRLRRRLSHTKELTLVIEDVDTAGSVSNINTKIGLRMGPLQLWDNESCGDIIP